MKVYGTLVMMNNEKTKQETYRIKITRIFYWSFSKQKNKAA